MEKKLYKCEFFSGYFTFLSSDDDKEKDAVNLAFENFKIDADEITCVELADDDESMKPVNAKKNIEKNYVEIDRNYTKKEVEAILAKHEISAESIVYKTGAGTPAYISGAYLNHFIKIFESPVIISKSIQEQADERLAEITMDAWRQYGQDRGKSLDDVASVINCQFQLPADELLELTDEEIQAEIDRMYTNDETDDDYSDEAYAHVDADLEKLKKECPDSFKGDWEKEDNDETDIDW